MYYIIFHHQYKVLAKSPLLPLGCFYIVTSLHILLWIFFLPSSPSSSPFLFFFLIFFWPEWTWDFRLPRWLRDSGDASLMPWSERSLGVGNSDPLQYSCLGNSMGRGAWWATVHGTTLRGHFNVPVIVILYHIPCVHSLIISIYPIYKYVICSIQKPEDLRFGVISCDC